MTTPTLYQRYDRHQAIALFGTESAARTLCNGEWVILPRVALCFATLGKPPARSHFDRAGRFVWVAGEPFRVSKHKHARFVPREVVAGHGKNRPLALFVHADATDSFMFVGQLAPSHFMKLPSGTNCGEAHFDLAPALPSAVWADLGGPQPRLLDHAAIDEALDLLRQPSTVDDRLTVLKQLVEYWHGPITADDGMPEDELGDVVTLGPLHWWYRWAGRRTQIMSGQNFLLGPDELKIKDDLLVFYVENQCCYEWAIQPEGDDPPVFGREGGTVPWQPEGVTLAEHLILACLFEAIICHAPYGASAAWLPEPMVNKIAERVPPVPIAQWGWGEMRFHVREGAFMFVTPNGELEGKLGFSVWLGAKTEEPLRFLHEYLGDDWEYQSI